MRDIVAYYTSTQENGCILISRCHKGIVDTIKASDWEIAIKWLTSPVTKEPVFNVCFSLHDFTRALFGLLPEEQRKALETQNRIIHQGCKIFYVDGRYLGLTLNSPIENTANVYRQDEVNITALKWWVSEEQDEPSNAEEVWKLGNKIVSILDGLRFYPTKLTSPVAVFTDCYLYDAHRYPTIFSWPEEKLDAMLYAEQMMRHEWRSAYQIGWFSNSHLYDITSAYPAVIAGLPSTDDCQCEHSTSIPSWSQWGVVFGQVEVNADISPIVYEANENQHINPKGSWKGYFTTQEIKWLEKWKAGSFKMEDGWFFRFSDYRPYRRAIFWLQRLRNSQDDSLSTIAKKMGQGISGKLDEDRRDGKKGDFYNPILAAMVRSHTRLKVADFIYQHKFQDSLIAVLVDSVLSSAEAEMPQAEGMGKWRYEGSSPSLVLSKGGIWRPDKRPQGISYEDLMNTLISNPRSAYYEFPLPSGTTRSIDLLLDAAELDRDYSGRPECGEDVLYNNYHSKAIEISS